ncbi:hypothetical protein ACLMJK_002670 [Lecanora helva]
MLGAPKGSRFPDDLRSHHQKLLNLVPCIVTCVCAGKYETKSLPFSIKQFASIEVIRWLGTIGARASACIRHLVTRFSSLLLKFNEDRFVRDRILAWKAALQALPRLLSLTFDFEQDANSSLIWASLDEDMLLYDPHVGNELAISATAWAKRIQAGPSQETKDWGYHPNLHQKRVTHALVAMDEAIPDLLLKYFSKILELSSKTSLEQNVTGLPRSFFEESGFYLARTYSLNENPQTPSISMSFGRSRESQLESPINSLRNMLVQLPHLLYLRVGCRSIDSSFLPLLPSSILTLDVSFTDTDPGQVVSNLKAMNERCRSLFTLAIAISPLHDIEPLDQEDVCFNKLALDAKLLAKWAPFWDTLDAMRSSRLKIWEGHAEGFTGPKRSAAA